MPVERGVIILSVALSKRESHTESNNALNAIYEQWRSDDDLADTDIEVIIENTADKLIAAREREQKLAVELAKKAQTEVLSDKPRFTDMFKRKGR